MIPGILTSIIGILVFIHGVRQINSSGEPKCSYPDEYVDRLPGIVGDPAETAGNIWPVYRMPKHERFYMLGKWKCQESSAPTKTPQTYCQRVG